MEPIGNFYIYPAYVDNVPITLSNYGQISQITKVALFAIIDNLTDHQELQLIEKSLKNRIIEIQTNTGSFLKALFYLIFYQTGKQKLLKEEEYINQALRTIWNKEGTNPNDEYDEILNDYEDIELPKQKEIVTTGKESKEMEQNPLGTEKNVVLIPTEVVDEPISVDPRLSNKLLTPQKTPQRQKMPTPLRTPHSTGRKLPQEKIPTPKVKILTPHKSPVIPCYVTPVKKKNNTPQTCQTGFSPSTPDESPISTSVEETKPVYAPDITRLIQNIQTKIPSHFFEGHDDYVADDFDSD